MRFGSCQTLLALSLLVCAPAAAQQEIADGVSRLAWGSVNVLVMSDTSRGVVVWGVPTARPEKWTKYEHEFVSSFKPEEVGPWVLSVRKLLGAEAPDPGESRDMVPSKPLWGRDSTVIQVMRKRKGARWDKEIIVYFGHHSGQNPLAVVSDEKEVQAFIRTMVEALPGSRYNVGNSHGPIDVLLGMEASGEVTYPRALPDNPHLHFEAGREGDVWVEFVVRPDGTPDMSTFRVLLTDMPSLVQRVEMAVSVSKFEPARINGTPVAARLYYRYYFRY